MSKLSHHLAATVKTSSDDAPSTSYTTSTCFSISLSAIFSSTQYCIVDSGATRHICSNANVFVSLKPISNATVTLPNYIRISVTLFGGIRLSPILLLTSQGCVMCSRVSI
ncbi:hypothetical protein PanWU01x14_139510 [Parasponia andersonii]|uniref:Retrovirus-related Pol polyprotein from transposon TNT 1-94-like beta-barrel domain-containing protein n=1 Tax=Parasponia andersonii TaxID=3476 RepID=A0A2P5CMI8_PARAD|nr:hypothetical protein PanWU01x14_139510 [Parasponia andersonii]